MHRRQPIGRARAARRLTALAGVPLLAYAVFQRGGPVRLASLALHRLRYGYRPPSSPAKSRLYAHGRHRLEAHLARLPNGRSAILAVPVDGPRQSAVYTVDEWRPWHDFERQAGLHGAPWGPCRSVSAGL